MARLQSGMTRFIKKLPGGSLGNRDKGWRGRIRCGMWQKRSSRACWVG